MVWKNHMNMHSVCMYNGKRSLFTVLAEEPARAHGFDSAMKILDSRSGSQL
jgi:hypothetical protein